jgi:hypothetical protein
VHQNPKSPALAHSPQINAYLVCKHLHDILASEKSPSVDVISKGHTMQEKYIHWLQGAAGGAVALAVVGFSWGGWSTSSGTAKQVEAAVLTAMIPACVQEVMADPAAAAELKVKRPSDYDDVVRDHLKRVDDKANRGYQFNRDCGKAIEALMAKMATKS